MASWFLRSGGDAEGPPQFPAGRSPPALRRASPRGADILIEKTRRIVPFDGIAVSGLDREGCRFGTGLFLASDLPPLFLEAYVQEEHAKGDPLLAQLAASPAMASDDEDEHRRLGLRRPQRLAYLLDYFGIGTRSFIPLRRGGHVYGGIVLTRAKPFGASERDYLQLIAEPLHAALSRPVIEALNGRMKLTPAEVQCLEFAGQGLISEEIAAAMSQTLARVDGHLKSATRKLGAANRSQAVAEAMRRGVIG